MPCPQIVNFQLQAPKGSLQCVDMAVMAADIDHAIFHQGRREHPSARLKSPLLLATLDIQRVEMVLKVLRASHHLRLKAGRR